MHAIMFYVGRIGLIILYLQSKNSRETILTPLADYYYLLKASYKTKSKWVKSIFWDQNTQGQNANCMPISGLFIYSINMIYSSSKMT